MKKISSLTTVIDIVITPPLIIALPVFITICIFLDAYNVHKPSNKNSAPVKKQTFR